MHTLLAGDVHFHGYRTPRAELFVEVRGQFLCTCQIDVGGQNMRSILGGGFNGLRRGVVEKRREGRGPRAAFSFCRDLRNRDGFSRGGDG